MRTLVTTRESPKSPQMMQSMEPKSSELSDLKIILLLAVMYTEKKSVLKPKGIGQ
jgi:hypothetical protein